MKNGDSKLKPLVTVNTDETFEEDVFSAELDIDLGNLQEALTTHGGRYFRYGKLHAIAEKILGEQQLALEIEKRSHETLEAKLNESYRTELLSKPDVKVTEKLIASLVLQDENYLNSQVEIDSIKAQLIELQFTTSILALAEKIFSKRTDVLTTLGYMARSERESDGLQIMSSRRTQRSEVEKLKAQGKVVRRVQGDIRRKAVK
jgi:hypothetical protein